MAPNNLSSLFALLAVVLLLPAVSSAAGTAFNITEILNGYPEFKLFNLLLSKTRVADEINNRNSVTVLVTDNADVDWLLRHSARLPHAAVKELVSVHVVLDYIDAAKLAALPPRGGPTQLTTLFQASGAARDRAGFLNVAPAPRGGAVFVSAAPGSLVAARFKRAVTAKPYNVSVLQISNLVVPRGFVTRPRSPSPTMRQMAVAPSPAPTPTPTTRLLPTAPSIEDETVEAPAPAPSHGHAVQATTSYWWSAAAASVGMACMLWVS
ncbi:hypothetical protein PR202_gb28095 [Eleusine coracana subsp. coracana]|uniref:FAS1 domain-containing protein n=1 Tax=Eleusine coracana subsp. coracana TaxID=191504 RepID=A0AAV5FWD8_ELECO|nr:hypothetical protein QOZ80_6AG0546960 [Eleusine coracana subsp. coracana]GJN39005.1 hypothetical protein PR202_gb28095 [Eleusine coracana subsp. coracana]